MAANPLYCPTEALTNVRMGVRIGERPGPRHHDLSQTCLWLVVELVAASNVDYVRCGRTDLTASLGRPKYDNFRL